MKKTENPTKKYVSKIRLFDIFIRQKDAEIDAISPEVESMSAAVIGVRGRPS